MDLKKYLEKKGEDCTELDKVLSELAKRGVSEIMAYQIIKKTETQLLSEFDQAYKTSFLMNRYYKYDGSGIGILKAFAVWFKLKEIQAENGRLPNWECPVLFNLPRNVYESINSLISLFYYTDIECEYFNKEPLLFKLKGEKREYSLSEIPKDLAIKLCDKAGPYYQYDLTVNRLMVLEFKSNNSKPVYVFIKYYSGQVEVVRLADINGNIASNYYKKIIEKMLEKMRKGE